MWDRWFKLSERGTTPAREMLGGLTTFMTMAYIIFVNPAILSGAFLDPTGAHLAGYPDVSATEVCSALTMATCVSAAAGTLFMAFWANLPVALAPGMGMNALFTFMVLQGVEAPWRVKLGMVFLSGVLFLALSLVRFRETVMGAVPGAIKYGAAAGIGLFIGFIGLQHGGVVVDHPATLVTLGDLSGGPALLTIFGLAVTVVLMSRRVPGAILLGLIATGAVGALTGVVPAPEGWAMPNARSLTAIFLKLDIAGALSVSCIVPILTFFFFDLFDTVGTLMGVGEEAGLMKDGRLPNAERALTADAAATVVGSLFGTSTVTSYIESAAGVAAGARTGLANLVTAALLVISIFLTPVVGVFGRSVVQNGLIIPVTAPALIVVGFLMCGALKRIEWSDPTEAFPAYLTVVIMPATFSISGGLAAGFVSYSLAKIATGRAREAHWLVHVTAWTFAAVYVAIRIAAFLKGATA